MAFSTIVIGTLCLYAVYYTANILYDLFLAGQSSEVRFDSEEEIEISEEENTLSFSDYTSQETEASFGSTSHKVEPTVVSIQEQEEQVEDSSPVDTPSMNGAMDIDAIVAHIQHSESPDELQYVTADWN